MLPVVMPAATLRCRVLWVRAAIWSTASLKPGLDQSTTSWAPGLVARAGHVDAEVGLDCVKARGKLRVNYLVMATGTPWRIRPPMMALAGAAAGHEEDGRKTAGRVVGLAYDGLICSAMRAGARYSDSRRTATINLLRSGRAPRSGR